MPASTFLRGKLLDHTLAVATFARPAATFIGLYRAAEFGPGPEVSGLGYARQEIQFQPAVNGAATNVALVTFPAADGGSWGTLTHFGLFDAVDGGNLLYQGALADPMVVYEDDPLLFDAGSITITVV